MRDIVIKQLEESAATKTAVARTLPDRIVDAAHIIIAAFNAGGKALLIGNGGSAADAQHIATELVGRFGKERDALPAIALTTDTSLLTAVANDCGYETVFSRQIEALAGNNDVLIAITTSGISPNILKAVTLAKTRGVSIIGLTGKSGGQLKDLADIAIMVPSENTPRIQEAHITIGHILCHLVENALFPD